MKNIFICLILISFGCNSYQPSAPTTSSVDSLRKDLVGIWGNPNESMPVWRIDMDSIYYFQQKASYPYKIINHDLIINFSNTKGALRNIHVVNDTMFFMDEVGQIVKGFRFSSK